ncbi:MAG: hypothetical protein AAF384_13505 [Pseudomonadota bacterium]
MNPGRFKIGIIFALVLSGDFAIGEQTDPASAKKSPSASAAPQEPADEERLIEAYVRASGRFEEERFLTLASSNGEFLTRFEPAATSQASGTLFVVPPPGQSVLDIGFFSLLVEYFASIGWAILVPQTPLVTSPDPAAQEIWKADLVQRITAVVKWASDNSTRPFVVLAMHKSSEVVADILNDNEQALEFALFGSFGAWAARDIDTEVPIIELIHEVSQHALKAAKTRALYRRRRGLQHELYIIPGATPRLGALNEIGMARLNGWIKRHAP